jgi:hypothetical protein
MPNLAAQYVGFRFLGENGQGLGKGSRLTCVARWTSTPDPRPRAWGLGAWGLGPSPLHLHHGPGPGPKQGRGVWRVAPRRPRGPRAGAAGRLRLRLGLGAGSGRVLGGPGRPSAQYGRAAPAPLLGEPREKLPQAASRIPPANRYIEETNGDERKDREAAQTGGIQ